MAGGYLVIMLMSVIQVYRYAPSAPMPPAQGLFLTPFALSLRPAPFGSHALWSGGVPAAL